MCYRRETSGLYLMPLYLYKFETCFSKHLKEVFEVEVQSVIVLNNSLEEPFHRNIAIPIYLKSFPLRET